MADYEYIQSSGVIVPDTATLLTTVEGEFQAVFGSDMIVTPDTPQGLLIAGEVSARDAVVRNNAALANQINPNLAGGVFLDAICALTALQRIAATQSTVVGTLAGVAATLIPAGTRVSTPAENIFATVADVTLDGSGNATVTFASEEYGPIPCAIGELTQIVDGVLGLETCTNAAAATLGINEQSDVSLRALRRNTLALQGISIGEAITSQVYAVPGVKSMTFRENVANSTQTIDGVSMVAHSIFACVDGGTDLDIATALLANKTVGANWNGAVTVNVTEPFSGQVYPVKFDRPTEVNINIRVTIKANTTISDPTTTVKDAILAYVNGDLSDESGFTVGTSVSPIELGGAISRLKPAIFVRNLEVSSDNGVTYQNTEIAIGLKQVARTNASRILVVIS